MTRPADRAQVASLGSLLLVAVVVISAGTFGAYYVASATGGGAAGGAGGAGSADGTPIDLQLSATNDTLQLSHNGGDSTATADLRVTVRNGSGEYNYSFESGAIRGGDGDERFDAGESWRLGWSQVRGTEVTVSVVDDAAGRLLLRETVVIRTLQQLES